MLGLTNPEASYCLSVTEAEVHGATPLVSLKPLLRPGHTQSLSILLGKAPASFSAQKSSPYSQTRGILSHMACPSEAQPLPHQSSTHLPN